jgi:hypothetical protein
MVAHRPDSRNQSSRGCCLAGALPIAPAAEESRLGRRTRRNRARRRYRCSGRRHRRPGCAVRQRQPLHELVGGFIRGAPVERHHRRRAPGSAAQLRPPSIADGRHLDLVGAPTDGLFVAMNCHVSSETGCEVRRALSCRRRRRSSEAVREASIHSAPPSPPPPDSRAQVFFDCRDLHRICTGYPQNFHAAGTCAAGAAPADPPR